MFKKDNRGVYYFEELRKYPEIVHGISSRQFGDFRQSTTEFLSTLALEPKNLIMMEQTHGNKIKVVDNKDQGKIVPQIDGLVTSEPGVILGVKSADCPNILFFDPQVKIVGVCHAGWRGILAHLPQKMIDLMILKGSIPENILVAIGPHIKKCCYEVKKDVSQRFEKDDLSNSRLDLTKIIVRQLVHSGIKFNKIFDSICTACNLKEFYSYRKDSVATYGEILSIISLK